MKWSFAGQFIDQEALMAEKRIADLFSIKTRFMRSAHLERDFQDSAALAGYVPTEFTHSCFERISEGLRPKSGQRAWRVTGDYGSGKSSFALLLAHAFAGHDNEMPPQLVRVVDFKKQGIPRPQYLPVLATCSRQPLGISILRALHQTLSENYNQGSRAKAAECVQRLLNAKQEPTDDDVFDVIIETNSKIIADSKGQGLLLIIDELGKFLEFAALNPHRQDVFLLQRLAEAATRSSKEPLFVVCLLHQGFNEYADHLNQSAQREWEKVAGRFDEIVFNQPVEQVAHLIASALNVRTTDVPKPQASSLRQAMEQTIQLGWFGASELQSLLDLATRLYPIHPTVLPALIRIFRRFGQNERSLFSFLLSNEPFGLQGFSGQKVSQAHVFRLHNLFDYVRTNFGHRLAVHSYRSHWNLIESVVESYASDDPAHLQLLKTVGILNLLNDDLLATEQSLLVALADGENQSLRQVKAALQKLHGVKRVLYDRGRTRGFCLWPHTSVDIEKAYDESRRVVQATKRVASLIQDHLETRPIVARRHYIESGNLRHYDVRYVPISELTKYFSNDAVTGADGLIVIPLCETVLERQAALEFARAAEIRRHQNWLVAVPQPLSNLTSLVHEVQRWEWVVTNTLELNADKLAREEVSRLRRAAKMQLESGVRARIGFRDFTGHDALQWFHQGRPLALRDGRQLMEELSRIFDETFREAPRIHNELVNRRALSSAAAAAQMRLVKLMFTGGKSASLGMEPDKKPPEKSMYLSVLLNTGIHQQHGDSWRIGEPHPRRDEKCNVLPTLRKVREIVKVKPDTRVNIAALFAELRKPPFGVRDGMLPLLLTVFAIAHEQDIAFYKDGTFLREMTGESMLILSKQPERFDIQYCKIEGVRAELFEKLLAVLEVKPSNERRVELLDVVKPLCVFVAQLPAYVHNTKKLSSTALAARDAILNAREPATLLFHDLPKACGFQSFTADSAASKEVQSYVRELKIAIDELRAAFPELQGRMRQRLRDWFDLPGSFQQFRTALAARAHQIVLKATEPQLKGFCLRLLDDNLPEMEWLESLGSFLALKPPSKWVDTEEDLFSHELAQLGNRFQRVESILFAGGKSAKDAIGVRVSVTQASGLEHEQVVHFTPDEEQQLRELETKFKELLGKGERLGLAAASRAIWDSLEKTQKAKP